MEKKLTAMQQLRNKLLEEIQNLKEPAQLNEHINGYREALKNVVNDIDAQMIEIEKQQIEDGFAEGHARFTKCEESELQEKAEQYYNETFKTK